MTIDEIYNLLKETEAQLENAGIDGLSKLELQSLIIDLKTQIVMQSFDPLKDIASMTVIDVSELRKLVPQVRQVIANDHARTELIGKIIHIVKTALKGAGLPIPS